MVRRSLLLLFVCVAGAGNVLLVVLFPPARRPPGDFLTAAVALLLVLTLHRVARNVSQPARSAWALGGPQDGLRWLLRGAAPATVHLQGPDGTGHLYREDPSFATAGEIVYRFDISAPPQRSALMRQGLTNENRSLGLRPMDPSHRHRASDQTSPDRLEDLRAQLPEEFRDAPTADIAALWVAWNAALHGRRSSEHLVSTLGLPTDVAVRLAALARARPVEPRDASTGE